VRRAFLASALSAVLVAVSLAAGAVYANRYGLPFVGHDSMEWSVGIYSGPNPFHLAPSSARNPVLCRADVTGIDARFVADPFLVHAGATWYLFVEVLNKKTDLLPGGVDGSGRGFL
jgi:hypothetical protein